jgi:hypothetical protein
VLAQLQPKNVLKKFYAAAFVTVRPSDMLQEIRHFVKPMTSLSSYDAIKSDPRPEAREIWNE